MTDTGILPTQAAPPGTPPSFDDEGGDDDRRRLMVIAGAVGLVVVLIAAYFLLKGGGDDAASSAPIPRGTPHSAASAPAAGDDEAGTTGKGGKSDGKGGKAHAGAVLPKKSHTRLARDPFKPLVTVPVVEEPTGGTTTTVSGGKPGASSGGGATAPAEGVVPSGAPSAIRLVSIKGHTSAVFDVTFAKHKTFRFDVAAPKADSATGTVFAKVFALLGIQGGEVTLQVGDDTPFDLKVGATHAV
jgi:hypothetical protein